MHFLIHKDIWNDSSNLVVLKTKQTTVTKLGAWIEWKTVVENLPVPILSDWLCLSGFSREAKQMGHICQEGARKIYFKELVHKIVEDGRSRMFRAGWQAVYFGRGWCSLESKGGLEHNCFFFGRPHSFSLRFCLDGMRLTHIIMGNLFYSKSTY